MRHSGRSRCRSPDRVVGSHHRGSARRLLRRNLVPDT